MNPAYELQATRVREAPRTWLVTGAAGFIGSNLVEALLRLEQRVVGLDSFATGHRRNLDDIAASVGEEVWSRFTFIEGDVTSLDDCMVACDGVDYVLHQAALGSVPRSIENPLRTHRHNVDGFVTVLVAARDSGVKRFVYAGSSSTYGDHPALPKVEHEIGQPLSPYALTKLVNELYAANFAKVYGLQCIGLRYFNVFGPRQDPNGPYAAVIPRWIDRLYSGQVCQIYGDGESSRDFCYIDNAVQANILAAGVEDEAAVNEVYNVACGERTTLNALYYLIRDRVARTRPDAAGLEPEFVDFRLGDVRHSLADIGKARRLLGYQPTHQVGAGLDKTLSWYGNRLGRKDSFLVTNGS